MRRSSVASALVLTVLCMAVDAGSAPPPAETTCGSCSECSAALSSGSWDIVRLNADLWNVAGTCVTVFAATTVTFDCDGHVVDGDDVAIDPEYGISVGGGAYGVTVVGCWVSDFSVGIHLWNASSCTVTDNVLTSNGVGIETNYLGFSSLDRNTVSGNVTGLLVGAQTSSCGFSYLTSCGNSVSDLVDGPGVSNYGSCTRCSSPGTWNGTPGGQPHCAYPCGHILSNGFEGQCECWDWSAWVDGSTP